MKFIKFLLPLFLILSLAGCGDSTTITDETTNDDSDTVTEPVPEPIAVYFPISVTFPGTDVLLMAESSFTYVINGGKPPYKFEFISGPGEVGENSGIFDAGDIVGNSIIDISDSSGQVVRARVRVSPILTVTPPIARLNVTGGILFNVSGGVPPYSYFIDSGSGFINGLGFYTSTATPTTASITIFDSQGNTVTAQAISNFPLKINPSSLDINRGETSLFTALDGFPPYTYRVIGEGNINNLNGTFIAPNSSGSSQVEVTDSMGNKAVAAVAINSRPLVLTPLNQTVEVNKTVGFRAEGGVAPFLFRLWAPDTTSCNSGGVSWTSMFCSIKNVRTPQDCYGQNSQWKYCSRPNLLSCDETIALQAAAQGCYNNQGQLQAPATQSDCLTASLIWFDGSSPENFCQQVLVGFPSALLNTGGTFTAPAAPDLLALQLKDSESTEIVTNIYVNNNLTISPSHLVTNPNLIEKFSANGGVPPYTFQILTGGGNINNSIVNAEGSFTAPSTVGTTTVQLRDSVNTIVTATIEISPELYISPLNPTIGIGNTVTFIGSGGVPPFRFDIVTGPGIMNVNGTFTADSGIIFAPQTTVVRITDAKEVKRLSTITINPAIDFAEPEIIVRSGTEKIIEGINGVPPYTLRFKNGSSTVGSSITNIPNGNNFIMKYIAGFVNDDVLEKLEIVDSLGNTVEKNITIFGGLVAYYDPDKSMFSSGNNSLDQNSIGITNNNDSAVVTKISHGLSNVSTVRIKNGPSCGPFEDYDFNKRFTPNIINANAFSFQLPRRSNITMTCGDGTDYKYDTLGNMVGFSCPVSGLLNVLNLRNYSSSEISFSCSSNGAVMFSGSCGKAPSNCSTNTVTEYNAVTGTNVTSKDVFRARISRSSSGDAVTRNLNFNVPLTQDADTYVSVDMWFKWNGDRSPETAPATASFNGTLVGFNNYNASFITVLNSGGQANKTLCFNTQLGSLDCFGMANPDPIIVNRWSHYVFVFNNGDVTKNKLYINGVQRSIGKQGSVDPVSRVVSNDFKIGLNYNNNTPLFRTRGDLGIIRVYDKEIDSSEVLNNYNEFKCLYQGVCN